MSEIKRIIAFLAAVSMALILLTGCGGKNADDSSLADLEIGDVICFGSYKQSTPVGQDTFDLSLYEPEPIEWRLVDIDDGFGLFVSEKVLDYYPYHKTHEDTTYADSDLRKWLNKDFINTAFSRDRRKIIKPVKAANPAPPQDGSIGELFASAGEDTEDKIFILSYDEVMRYFPNEEDRIASPTKYAVGRGTWRNADNHCDWWLRTQGMTNSHSIYVTETGYVNTLGEQVNAEYIGVRPAMWLRLGNWPKGHGPTF